MVWPCGPHDAMITINLLPETPRHAKAGTFTQLHRSPLVFAGVIGLIVVTGLLVLLRTFRQHQLTQLTVRLQQFDAKKQGVSTLKTALQQFREQQAIYQGLAEARSRWAQRLNILSDAMPDGVWLTHLVLEPSRGLVIEGAAVQQGEEVMAQIGRLVQALKEDPEFSRAVHDVQIESIKSVKDGELDVTQFALICEMAEAAVNRPAAAGRK